MDADDYLLREHYQEACEVVKGFEAEARASGVDLESVSGTDGSTESPSMLNLGESLLADYIERLSAGNLPQLIPQGELDGIEVGPELVTIIGAPPGAGKTAVASQITFDGLARDESLRAYVANAEMGFDALMRRELTRATRIKSDYIRFGTLDPDELTRIKDAADEIGTRLSRVGFYVDPVGMESLTDLLYQPPGLVIVDYIQKFAPADKDARQGVNVVMALLRRLANHGHAVLALSATKRDTKGNHSSGELGLASFRESGEGRVQRG